jgi:hypothetical protein
MTRTRLALAALTAAALLSACNDDPEPKVADPTPSSSSAVVTSAPTTASATEMPPELNPEAAVRAWVAARNAALHTGDTTQLRTLSQPGCDTCEEHIKPIEQVFAAGGRFDTPGWSIDQLKVDSSSGQSAKVDVAMTMAGGTTVAESGGEPVTYLEDHRLMYFKLISKSSWIVSFVGYYQ